jgi:dihydrofolate synthase/folylpolyglutamate synthase
LENNLDYQKFKIKGLIKEYEVKTKLLGLHQGENISLSIQPLEFLKKQGVEIKEKNIKDGIEKTINPGRMEIINKKPIIILDGAHNPNAFKNLFETLKNDFRYNKLFFIIGVLKDKNIKSMIKPIISNSQYIITTQSNNDRALNSEEIEKIIKKQNKNLKVDNKKHIKDAIQHALSLIQKNDLLCISGSLYTVSEAREYFKKNRKVLTINH